MKSLCIKLNNSEITDYLLNEFEHIDLDDLFISSYHFKIYDNIILHYKGSFLDIFLDIVSEILQSCIIDFFEENIINRILKINYFYFTPIEKKEILEFCSSFFYDDLEESSKRLSILKKSISEYISSNKSIVLDGFVNFRIKSYVECLDDIVDLSVNNFLVEKEYKEFVSLLKIYINSKPSETKLMHLIYSKSTSLLLDDKKNIIDITSTFHKAKYLSDISFSSNDYILNALLNYLPNKLIIHLADIKADAFIETLKTIFESRVIICSDCCICELYKEI